MLSKRLKSDFILLFVAIIWGSAFVGQRIAAEHIGPFLFNGSRFLLGALILLPLALKQNRKINLKKMHFTALAGLILFIAGYLQQAGLKYTTAGNAGFITGLYVVFVPLFLAFIFRERLGWTAWVAAFTATIGLFLLSVQDNFTLAPGDGLEFIGAIFWALHVILVSKIIKEMEILHFAIGQYVIAGILNLIVGSIFEWQTLPGFAIAWWAVVYTGILSVGIGYTLQAVGQRHAPPTDAAIILSMEAVFAAGFGYLFLNEILTLKQLLGCILILAGIIVAQFRPKKK
ncbi:MAG: DMT family transporter [Calditrichia bacterium]|nr:DMT family transporter [Calditrichia bacterium]